MAVIDQRILIAAPAEAIWVYLVSPTLIVRWHKGCQQLSILSTRTTGVGARRRVTDQRGRAVIEEITRWLDNLGYEYTMVDGPYRHYRGRLRLQPVPEGTIVTWMVEFRLRGFLAGLRSLLGVRRRTEVMMADGLRQLRRLVESSGARIDPERQARFGMRMAPSAEDRATLAQSGAKEPRISSRAPRASKIVEPPIESISPPPAEQEAALHAAVPMPSGPDGSLLPNATALSLADTKPRPPARLRESISRAGISNDGALNGILPRPVVPPMEPHTNWSTNARTVPISLVAPPPEPAPVETQTLHLESIASKQVTPAPETLPEQMPTPRGIRLSTLSINAGDESDDSQGSGRGLVPPPTSKEDTGELSIWDVFGTVPPSERTKTDLEAIIASLNTPPMGMESVSLNGMESAASHKKPILNGRTRTPSPSLQRKARMLSRRHKSTTGRGLARLRAHCTPRLRHKPRR